MKHCASCPGSEGVKSESTQPLVMSDPVVALVAEDGRTWTVNVEDKDVKIKGLGVFNPAQLLSEHTLGSTVTLASKRLTILPAGLPELRKGMLRRAQTIGDKDAGILVSRLGIGRDDAVLEAGLGSAGLGLHIARSLGPSGHHITVEPRQEHASVGLHNLELAAQAWPDGPRHSHIDDVAEACADEVSALAPDGLDAVVLDMADHTPAIAALAPLLRPGGRMACYCPVTSQLERAWEACEAAGLHVDWAGEVMERPWSKASRGGVRPS
ncbi:MAG TPA: hypothetical protein D7I01_05240, partial [Candidatus Poseidoniales archaeon]